MYCFTWQPMMPWLTPFAVILWLGISSPKCIDHYEVDWSRPREASCGRVLGLQDGGAFELLSNFFKIWNRWWETWQTSWNKPQDCLLDITSCVLAWVGVRNESMHAQGWFHVMELANPIIQFHSGMMANFEYFLFFIFPGQGLKETLITMSWSKLRFIQQQWCILEFGNQEHTKQYHFYHF